MPPTFNGSFTLQSRLLRGIGHFAGSLRLLRRPLSPESLLDEARRRADLSDFGSWEIEEPLAVLVSAYARESHLNLFGRFAAQWDMLRFLSNLLRLRAEEKRAPDILEESIVRPIFILGLPRSGTTFLHNLMGEDPGNAVPRCWQTIYPYPDVDPAAYPDRRAERVAAEFSKFLWLAPELPNLHPLDACGAQECIEITAQVIRSMRFDTTHYVPSYGQWLDARGHVQAYRFHKRFLQHLQHQGSPLRWVLKSPDHIFAFDAIRQVYPDARFIFVHRDPMRVLASVARLTEVLRRPFTRRIDRRQIGRQVSDSWAKGAMLLVRANESLRALPERVFHINYRDLTHDTFEALRAIYRHFSLQFNEEAERRVQRLIARKPDGGYGHNAYYLSDYGLDEQIEHRRYAEYLAYFRIDGAAIA